jgi:hypothetical protein
MYKMEEIQLSNPKPSYKSRAHPQIVTIFWTQNALPFNVKAGDTNISHYALKSYSLTDEGAHVFYENGDQHGSKSR